MKKPTYKLLHSYFTSPEVREQIKTIPKPIQVALKLLPKDDYTEKFSLAIALSEFNLLLAHLNNKIKLNSKTKVTTNTMIFLFGDSGEGKDRAVNTVLNGLSGGYKVLNAKREALALKQAKNEAIEATGEDTAWKEYHIKPRELRQTLSTPEGLIKSGNIIEKSSIGSYFQTTSELGSEIQSNTLAMMENMKLLAMGYDTGKILTKTVKTDELQLDHIENLNINALMFSSIFTLTKSQAVKERFVNFMMTAMARRSFLVHVTEKVKDRNFETLEEFDKYYQNADTSFEKYITILSEYSEKLISTLPHNTEVQLSASTRKLHNRYLHYCKYQAKQPALLKYKMAKISVQHNAWKTLKQAGLIAMMNGRMEIQDNDYLQAIGLTTKFLKDTISFQIEIDKEPYELLVDYCITSIPEKSTQLSKHFLLKNGFLEKSQLTKPKMTELADMCTQLDSNGIYSFVEKTGKIRYTRLTEKVKPKPTTAVEKKKIINSEKTIVAEKSFIVSVLELPNMSKENRNKNCHEGYKNSKVLFENLGKILSTDCAFNTMHYKDGKRNLESLQGEQEAIILDIDDGTLPITQMHELLKDYNHHIATTSNKDNKFKYRIIIQLDKPVKLEPRQWKRFYKSIGNLLGIKVDTNINQAGIFYGYADSEVYSCTQGVTLAVKPHLIEAYKEELTPEIKPLKTAPQRDVWLENRLEKLEFAYNAPNGKGSLALLGAMLLMKKLGFSKSIIKETIEEINSFWEVPMKYSRLKATLLNQI